MKPAWILAALTLALTPVGAAADCYVTWDCGGSSQCAQAYGGASGRRGPYASCSGFSQQDQVSQCSCSAGASSGGVSVGGYTPQQQVMLQGAAAIGAAIGQGLRNSFQQRAAQQQAAQAQAQQEQDARAAEEAREVEAEQKASQDKFNADKDQLLGQLRDDDSDGKSKAPEAATDDARGSGLQFKSDDAEDASSAASSPPKKAPSPPAVAAHDAAYLRGLRDAGDCGTQNAGGYCVGLSAPATIACSRSYHRGYRAGEKTAQAKLRRAWQEGSALKNSGKPFDSSAHPAEGSCGSHVAQAYADGYYGRPFTLIGR